MTFRAKITMDNGQSKVIFVDGRGASDVIDNLVWKGFDGDINKKFITVSTEDKTKFTYCVGKLSTIEIFDYK